MHRVICAAPDEVGSSAGTPMPMPSRCPPRACSILRVIHCIAIRSTCSHRQPEREEEERCGDAAAHPTFDEPTITIQIAITIECKIDAIARLSAVLPSPHLTHRDRGLGILAVCIILCRLCLRVCVDCACPKSQKPHAHRLQVARDARRTTTLRKAYRRCSTIGYRTPSTEGPLSANFTSLGNTQHRRVPLPLLRRCGWRCSLVLNPSPPPVCPCRPPQPCAATHTSCSRPLPPPPWSSPPYRLSHPFQLHLLEHDALPQPAGPPAQLGVGVAGADGEHCPIQHRLPARPARQVQVGGRRVR